MLTADQYPLLKPVVALVGPTAVGKSAVGLRLAQALETEVLAADAPAALLVKTIDQLLGDGGNGDPAEETAAFTRAGENGRLTLAVPAKGRMAEPALRLCADAGPAFEVTERSLVVPCANAPVDLLLVRPSDIPEYAQDGVVDLGITGANLVAEAAADVETVAELGFARCTLDGRHSAPPRTVGTPSALSASAIACNVMPCSRIAAMRSCSSGTSETALRPGVGVSSAIRVRCS